MPPEINHVVVDKNRACENKTELGWKLGWKYDGNRMELGWN